MSALRSRLVLLALTIVLLSLPFAVTVKATSVQSAGLQQMKRESLTFSDLTGQRYTLGSSTSVPCVFVFLSTECPIANRYTSRILALGRAFMPLGFRFFAVYPNENESEEDIRQHAADWRLPCPVVRDDGRLVKYFGITMTPEVALVNASGAMVYRGRIDDNADSEQVHSRDLAAAILAVYSGRPVSHPRTEPFGCPIRYLPTVMVAKETPTKLPALPNPSHTLTLTPAPTPAEASPVDVQAILPPVKPLVSSDVQVLPSDHPHTNLKTVTRNDILATDDSKDAVKPEKTGSAADSSPAVVTPAPTASVSVVRPAVTSPSVRVVAVTKTPAVHSRSSVITTSITYTRDVAPILFERCLPCHRQGEVAPFRIDTYEQAVAWANQIYDATSTRRMPPWKADSHGEFHDEMRLSNRELAILSSWVHGGTPYGRAADMPTLPVFPRSWKMGDPDAILPMPEEYDVPADGRDIYRCFVIPTNFSSDRWVSGVEYQAGNRSVVHHVSAFIDTTGKARKLDNTDPGPGYTNPTPANGPGFTPVTGLLGGWVPGHEPRKLPPGVGIFLPKGADIVLEVHYHPSGRPEKDRTRFGLYFARENVTKRLHIGDLSNPNFRIPPGAEDYKVEASTFLSDDITLLSISPHMHFIGRSMRVVATLPSGVTQVLVDVPDWDFRWQPSYRFKSPVHLPRRTRIDMVAHFDNSEKNPRNPNHPPREMTYGESTSDEMCTVFVAYTVDKEDIHQDSAASSQ